MRVWAPGLRGALALRGFRPRLDPCIDRRPGPWIQAYGLAACRYASERLRELISELNSDLHADDHRPHGPQQAMIGPQQAMVGHADGSASHSP